MTDLTEQWKKGELPSGWYWVEGSRVEGIYAYTAEYLNNMYRPSSGERIIEQVPSYKEWQAKLEQNSQLKERNDSLNNRDINLCRIANEIRDENFALKELLKECKEMLMSSNYQNMTQYHEVLELRDKINKIIGEK